MRRETDGPLPFPTLLPSASSCLLQPQLRHRASPPRPRLTPSLLPPTEERRPLAVCPPRTHKEVGTGEMGLRGLRVEEEHPPPRKGSSSPSRSSGFPPAEPHQRPAPVPGTFPRHTLQTFVQKQFTQLTYSALEAFGKADRQAGIA